MEIEKFKSITISEIQSCETYDDLMDILDVAADYASNFNELKF